MKKEDVVVVLKMGSAAMCRLGYHIAKSAHVLLTVNGTCRVMSIGVSVRSEKATARFVIRPTAGVARKDIVRALKSLAEVQIEKAS